MPDRLHYTDSDEANALIATDPMALLIGFALDQQVPVQKAFSGPLALKERLGSLDAATLAEADLEPAFPAPPPPPPGPPSSPSSASGPRSTASPARWRSASTTSRATSATATTATPPASGPRRRTATRCAPTSRRCRASAR